MLGGGGLGAWSPTFLLKINVFSCHLVHFKHGIYEIEKTIK